MFNLSGDCRPTLVAVIVYRLKSVGALKTKFVAPMPEQIMTPTIHFYAWVQRILNLGSSADKLTDCCYQECTLIKKIQPTYHIMTVGYIFMAA